MITYNKTIIGSYDYINPISGTIYKIEVRQGNMEGGVHIWIDEEEYAHLFNFIADKQHIRNMIKNNHDVFENCENIRFNIADKGAKIQAEYACKCGHEVTIYYKQELEEWTSKK